MNTATGILSAIGTIATGAGPTSIVIHPSGRFAYVTNSVVPAVTMYRIDVLTGALTPIGTVAT